jgi:flagellar hook-basal body complex protein FliE
MASPTVAANAYANLARVLETGGSSKGNGNLARILETGGASAGADGRPAPPARPPTALVHPSAPC